MTAIIAADVPTDDRDYVNPESLLNLEFDEEEEDG